MAPSVSGSGLPSGCQVFTTMPDILFILEFIFGGLVWTLVASTQVNPANPQGWVMFVAIFCFVFTTIFFLIYICGANQSSVWSGLDVGYHLIAVIFQLGSAVALAIATQDVKALYDLNLATFKSYQEDIAAVVMAYLCTLTYFIHAVFSIIRFRSS
ncbi:mal, T cell differentiation protein b isoform X2 [Electrophorus electricus]|uniref:Myelin and lymphocyte protein n=1 Tax=Electrophorus electricus TaxID=8005 RepID=A0A4W4DV68_ELEEL|nr:mal, T cell differentiation protein b isoform X2 [Electrophorus electricus]